MSHAVHIIGVKTSQRYDFISIRQKKYGIFYGTVSHNHTQATILSRPLHRQTVCPEFIQTLLWKPTVQSNHLTINPAPYHLDGRKQQSRRPVGRSYPDSAQGWRHRDSLIICSLSGAGTGGQTSSPRITHVNQSSTDTYSNMSPG